MIVDSRGFPVQIFLEQKKMLKTGLNIARFRQHIPMIEEETIEYFKHWGDSGDRGLTLIISVIVLCVCIHANLFTAAAFFGGIFGSADAAVVGCWICS